MPAVNAELAGNRNRNLAGLTGLRMVAATAVYLSHLRQPEHLNTRLATFMNAGYTGVTVFFVLSGFVLGLNYYDRFVTPHARETWNYVVARVARIYPLYLAILLFVVVQDGLVGKGFSALDLHVFGLQAWSPSLGVAFGYNGPAWSVSVELFLYACFPLLVLLLARLRGTASLLVVLALTIGAVFVLAGWFVHVHRDVLFWTDPRSAHRWLYIMPVTRLGDFTAGLLLSRLFRKAGGRGSVAARWIGVVGGAAMVALMSSKAHLFSAWSWDASYLVPSLAIIWGLAHVQSRRWLASPTMVAAGEASYAFYLIHTQVMVNLGAGLWGPHGVTAWSVANQTLIFLIVVAVALGLHHMIERPARRWLTQHASLPIGMRVGS
jgi:peptidoglycan/LPS O-acetylase OafA/YrhL